VSGISDSGAVAVVVDGTVQLEGRLLISSFTSFMCFFEATQKKIRLNHRRRKE